VAFSINFRIVATTVIHIATVHWNTDRWIAPQSAFLRRHLKKDFRLYAWLNNIPQATTEPFYYCCQEPVVPHATKLNLLADIILAAATSPDDVLIFLDGDAFPIADLEPRIFELLSTHKLIAVQRLENDGDCQPHPCFCVTTVGFWKAIKGDWNEGFCLRRAEGKAVTDVGANLLKQLRDQGIDWAPLLRSNTTNLHPVYFGIYGGLVYHHGAGFRQCQTRFDRTLVKFDGREKVLSKIIPGYHRVAHRRRLGQIIEQNTSLSEKVFATILDDPEFHRQFISLQQPDRFPQPA